MGLSILFTDTWWDNTPGLTLPEGEVALVVDDDVAGFSGGLRANNPLGGNNFTSEGCLIFPHVDRNGTLVPIRSRL